MVFVTQGVRQSFITRGLLLALLGLVSMSFGCGYLAPWDKKLTSSDRFKLVMGEEAVLDKETGLVWQRKPEVWSGPGDINMKWAFAMSKCDMSTVGGRRGWRLPTASELSSLTDPSVPIPGPSLPSGHPFLNIQDGNSVQGSPSPSPGGYYWTSTDSQSGPDVARTVNFGGISPNSHYKDSYEFGCWCVRGVPGGAR